MCTCIKLKSKDTYFGRTLDLEFHYNEEVVITPRNYTFKCDNSLTFKNKYALIGMAFVNNDYPLYYEASNEKGLAIAGLNFPVNAKYNSPIDNKLNLTPFELIPYFLGNYKSVKELRDDLSILNITNINFAKNMPLSPLHFMISDKDESIVIEQTSKGLKVYENKYNVMTNNPEFDLQVKNIKKYEKLTNKYKDAEKGNYTCVGLGLVNLPGDYSSMSRFTKAYVMSKFVKLDDNEDNNVSTFFHTLDSISMVKGSVLTKNNLDDITFYSSCINLDKGIYYYKTYNNNQINCLKLTKDNIINSKLTRYKLTDTQNINYLN